MSPCPGPEMGAGPTYKHVMPQVEVAGKRPDCGACRKRPLPRNITKPTEAHTESASLLGNCWATAGQRMRREKSPWHCQHSTAWPSTLYAIDGPAYIHSKTYILQTTEYNHTYRHYSVTLPCMLNRIRCGQVPMSWGGDPCLTIDRLPHHHLFTPLSVHGSFIRVFFPFAAPRGVVFSANLHTTSSHIGNTIQQNVTKTAGRYYPSLPAN